MRAYRLIRRRDAASLAEEPFSAPGDGEAVVRALDLCRGEEGELWAGGRLVIRIPAERRREGGRERPR